MAFFQGVIWNLLICIFIIEKIYRQSMVEVIWFFKMSKMGNIVKKLKNHWVKYSEIMHQRSHDSKLRWNSVTHWHSAESDTQSMELCTYSYKSHVSFKHTPFQKSFQKIFFGWEYHIASPSGRQKKNKNAD